MKKNLILILTCVIIFCLYGCSNSGDSPTIIVNGNDTGNCQDILEAVLANEKLFITESGSAVYLKDYELFDEDNASFKASSYSWAYVDFDDDQIDEMIINISKEIGIYLILHYNGHDVFGFQVTARTMSSIKTDGTFSGSNGADCTYYFRLSFGNKKLNYTKTAEYNTAENIYRVNGNAVTEDEILQYIAEWDKKDDISWTHTQEETPPTEATEETVPEVVTPSGSGSANTPQYTINLNQYITTEFYGYSGAGMADARFDQAQFLADYKSKITFRDSEAKQAYFDATGDQSSPAEVLLSLVNKFSLTADEALSNGDIVALQWKLNKNKIDKYFDINISCQIETYTVANLTVPEEFNPMDYIQVSYTGVAPCGSIQISIDTSKFSDTKLAEKIRFACSSKYYKCSDQVIYQPEQEIVVYYTATDLNDSKSLVKFIDTYGLVPVSTQKSFTLTGFDYYPTQLDQIDLNLLDEADRICRQNIAADTYVTPKSINLSRVYYSTPSIENYNADAKWSLYAIYKVEAVAEFWSTENTKSFTRDLTFYYVVELRSPKITGGQTTYASTSTSINPSGSNSGDGFVCWEIGGQLFDNVPAGNTENAIAYYCYANGFSSITDADRAIRNRGGQIELKDY